MPWPPKKAAFAATGADADSATNALTFRSFLVSTHYTRYDSHPALFTLNLCALLFVGLAPKLPAFHRLRIKFFDAGDSGQTPGESTCSSYALSLHYKGAGANCRCRCLTDPSAPPTPRSDDIVR